MAKYIKQEMVDLSGKGEEKIYYRLQTERNIDFNELAQEIESRHGMMNRGLVKNVMAYVVDTMAELMGKGYSVSIDGLGTFRASLGLEKDKEMEVPLCTMNSSYQSCPGTNLTISANFGAKMHSPFLFFFSSD